MFPIFWLARVWEKHVNTKSLRIKRVNTKTNQFSPFFGLQEFEKNMSTPKLVFFPFFGFQEFEKKHVNTKIRQFSHFLDSRSWEIYIYVYACPFKPFWKKTLFLAATLHFHILPSILVYADGSKFQSVNTKTSQFSPFFDLHEFEKNMSTPKVWEKNMSTPKLINFPHFLDSRSLRKNMSTPKLVIFPFFGFQEVEKKHVNTKTTQFTHFLDSRSWEKYIYVYVYMHVCSNPFERRHCF